MPSHRLVLLSVLVPLHTGRAYRYRCELCDCGFDKLKNHEAHLQGKRHAANVASEQSIWDAYASSGWWYSPTVSRPDVTRQWSLERFVQGLPGRSRSSNGRTLGAAADGGEPAG